MVLVDQLPTESATSTAIRNSVPEDELAARRSDPKRAPWSSTDYLLATLVDEVRHLAWMYAQSHSKSKVPHPDPIERPGIGVRRRRIRAISEIKAIDPRLRGLSDEDAIVRYKEMTGRDAGGQ
jgi:hypothetical protein